MGSTESKQSHGSGQHGSSTQSRHARWRSATALASTAALALGLALAPTAAVAYTTTGCKWSSRNLTIDVSLTNGVFRTAVNSALNNYTLGTDVNLTGTTSTGPSFTARNANYGATGWEGQKVVEVRQFGGDSLEPPVSLLEVGDQYLLYLTPSGLAAPLDAQYYVTGANAGIFANGDAESARGSSVFRKFDGEPGEELPESVTVQEAMDSSGQ